MRVAVDGSAVFARARTAGANGADGPPLLFLHGAGMDGSVWNRLTCRLPFPSLAPDLPGHGRSGGPALTGIVAMADWLARLIALLPGAPPVLAGHSMGALVALDFAARYPGRLTGLVLAGAAASMPVNPDLMNAARQGKAFALDAIAAWSLDPDRKKPAQQARIRAILARSGPGVLASDLAACDGYGNALSMAAGLALPCLILSGSRDKMTPWRNAQPLAEAIKGGQLSAIARAGHMPMTERPAEMAAAIEDFVQGVVATRSKVTATSRATI